MIIIDMLINVIHPINRMKVGKKLVVILINVEKARDKIQPRFVIKTLNTLGV